MPGLVFWNLKDGSGKNMKTEYNTQNFYGTVILKDWMSTLNNRDVKRITGICTLVKDEDIAGFKTRGTEANWGIRVVGVREQWTVLGCQIRAVVAHDKMTNQSPDNAYIVP